MAGRAGSSKSSLIQFIPDCSGLQEVCSSFHIPTSTFWGGYLANPLVAEPKNAQEGGLLLSAHLACSSGRAWVYSECGSWSHGIPGHCRFQLNPQRQLGLFFWPTSSPPLLGHSEPPGTLSGSQHASPGPCVPTLLWASAGTDLSGGGWAPGRSKCLRLLCSRRPWLSTSGHQWWPHLAIYVNRSPCRT